MRKELASKYNHLEVEKGKYQTWIDKKYFEAGDKSKTPFTIVIPPPNVTGKLHLGHAWDTTIQDMMIRYKRLQGFDALWLPGMDHAGIATQAKVEERLRKDGISRYDLGREKFLEIAYEWKDEYATFIRAQWEKLGLSLDYSKERFTLDEGLSKAVRTVFVCLYEKGIIYQGERIINWDPAQRTALSNIEVIHKEIEGAMYYFRYEIVDSEDTIVIATTRPETMFGDVAIFVHPKDERYTKYIGKYVINPANGEKLPIMADDYIDMSFGTAVMKCTPAHDANDHALSRKYKLAQPICMNQDGTINELGHKYQGQDRFECRANLVKEFEDRGIVVKIEKHLHQVGHSERSNAIVEPYLSKQWFVRMEPLANQSLANQQTDDKVNFVPERFEKTFTTWMENIEDWCISRQLWWGHSIPAWYHKETGEIYVGMEAPQDIENWKQDEDVLDTWFSSALWPFSTLNWPDTEDELYQRYFPTSFLATAYDIIFFWVSRMIFQSLEFTGKKPFNDVLIHGLIRDEQGRKMSKSLGNGIDPMDEIDKYGVDSLRFFLTTNSAPGQDLRYTPEKVEAAWNFINKIWNASRFVLMNIDENMEYSDIKLENLSVIDEWILKRLNDTIASVNENMDKYEFSMAGNELYKFVWDDFCSWYIELAKVNLNGTDEIAKKATQDTLVYILMAIVKMLHPFMPFVTEEIYQTLPHIEESVCITTWPENMPKFDFENSDAVAYLIELIQAVREIRATYAIKNAIELAVTIKTNTDIVNYTAIIAPFFKKLCNISSINCDSDGLSGEIASVIITGGNAVQISLEGHINMDEEIAKLEKEISRLEGEIKRGEGMLANPNFVNKAPAAKLDEEKSKLSDYKMKYETTKQRLAEIKK